jgi:hypothetical protein
MKPPGISLPQPRLERTGNIRPVTLFLQGIL